ncbi:hypothetical protein TNCV_1483591 [Trichonephila clavipes]|nr:hypothetical protein TNCV_1483591 [Trichonephila clavipes]
MEFWASQGVSKMKMNMGVATYGKTFTLADASNNGLGAPATGSGHPGAVSQKPGTLCYNELRLRAKTARLWLPQSASLTVRCPQRYVLLFSFFIETRGESETYKKDGTDKDYTTNT